MSTRVVRWREGADDVSKMRSSTERLTKSTKQTIAIICSAVKNISSSSTHSHPQQTTAGEIEMHIDAFKPCDMSQSDKIETMPDNHESKLQDTEVVSKNSDKEREALLESRKHHSNDHHHHHYRPDPILIPNTLPPSIVGTHGLSSGQNTPLFPHESEHAGLNNSIWTPEGQQSMVDMLSAVYGIVVVVMGVAFPISQVISSKIPPLYYEGFYTYLYIVAIGFFSYVYLLLKTQFIYDFDWKKRWRRVARRLGLDKSDTGNQDAFHYDSSYAMANVVTNKLRAKLGKELDPTKSANHGSFYLRIGAVVFGVGSMIYSGLEFGQYFEMSSTPICNGVMLAVTPAARMIFTFFQMYFVFLNAKMQIVKSSNVIVARFGLMHMVATNLCVWLNLIVQETMHEMHFDHSHGEHGHHGSDGHGSTGDHSADHGHHSPAAVVHQFLNSTFEAILQPDEDVYTGHHSHSIERRATVSDDCHRADLMGTITQNASPFLFPCAIEYSLICAAIMYEIWKHTGHHDDHHENSSSHSSGTSPSGTPRTPRTPNSLASGARRSPHHYSVDCTNANKGLFFGIFILVLTIISMILFFVLINRDDYKDMAITEIHLSELILYMMTLAAVLIGIIQVNQLRFDPTRKLDLDNILLIVALTGVISYNVFTIIGTQFSSHLDTVLVLMNALTAVIQGILQTVFVLDASKRHLYTRRQLERKPGREVITFLMVTNFAMWAVITLEKSRSDAHPVQSEFFGQFPWTIITNISSPLAIFYRYHSTVCLCEIWKRCYKVKSNESSSST